MKTTISKDLRHSLLVEKDELLSLYSFVSSRYETVDAIARCNDGSRLEAKEIKEITAFENPNYRRIKSISITAQNAPTERLTLEIQADRAFTTAELEIVSEVDEQALYTSREVLNQLAEMKPWYDLLARIPISYVLLGLWGLSGLVSTAAQLFGFVPPSSAFSRFSVMETLNILVLVTVIAFAIVYPLDRVQRYLFPKVFFLIGKQEKTMQAIRQWRGWVFGGLVLAIITGVIGNAVYDWLVKK